MNISSDKNDTPTTAHGLLDYVADFVSNVVGELDEKAPGNERAIEALRLVAGSIGIMKHRIPDFARSAGGDSELADRLEALGAKATPGPWAWDQRGEKVNEWGLGTAFDADEKQLAGRFTDEDAIYDEYVCSHEAAACNYTDPDLICALRNNLTAIIAALRCAESHVGPSETTLLREAHDFIEHNVGLQDAFIDYDGKSELLRKIAAYFKEVHGEQI